MADKKTTKCEKKTIEAWAEETGISIVERAGTMELHCWVSGKNLTRFEFEAAVEKFRKAPIKGGK